MKLLFSQQTSFNIVCIHPYVCTLYFICYSNSVLQHPYFTRYCAVKWTLFTSLLS